MKKKTQLTNEGVERRKQKRRSILAAVCFLVVSFAVLIGLEAVRSASEFVVTPYVFKTSKVTAPVELVLVSDLHESEFGKNNEKLVSKLAELSPDAILCVGDMISHNDTEDQLHIGVDLLRAAAGIAPTYLSLGNHERTYVQKHGNALLDMYAETGVTMLENRYADITVNGQTIRVGGTSEYCFNYGQDWGDYHASEKYAFLKGLSEAECFSVLLCHRPTAYYLESEAASYEDWDIDLVLCGHTHGGLWRLPFIGSVYLPQQGFFPKYDYGLFNMGNSRMIVGAGLGHEGAFFRLFDPCEVVVIRLVPEEDID